MLNGPDAKPLPGEPYQKLYAVGYPCDHCWVYGLARRSIRDLGMPVGVIGERQHGYAFACAETGRDGEVCFGQHERIHHLWVYSPAVPASELTMERG